MSSLVFSFFFVSMSFRSFLPCISFFVTCSFVPYLFIHLLINLFWPVFHLRFFFATFFVFLFFVISRFLSFFLCFFSFHYFFLTSFFLSFFLALFHSQFFFIAKSSLVPSFLSDFVLFLFSFLRILLLPVLVVSKYFFPISHPSPLFKKKILHLVNHFAPWTSPSIIWLFNHNLEWLALHLENIPFYRNI